MKIPRDARRRSKKGSSRGSDDQSSGTYDERLGREAAVLPTRVISAIEEFMYDYSFSRKQLAERMGVTPGRVTQILSGDENLTLRSLAAVAAALGAEFHVMLAADGAPGDGRERENPLDEGDAGGTTESEDTPSRAWASSGAGTY